jgi:hypothetical protein
MLKSSIDRVAVRVAGEREIASLYFFTTTKQHGPFDQMLQFAHVPWPRIMDHPMYRGQRKYLWLLAKIWMNCVSYIADFFKTISEPKPIEFLCTRIASLNSNIPLHPSLTGSPAFNRDKNTRSKSGLYLSRDQRNKTSVLE